MLEKHSGLDNSLNMGLLYTDPCLFTRQKGAHNEGCLLARMSALDTNYCEVLWALVF